MRIKIPEFSDHFELLMRLLDEQNKVPYNISRGYFLLRVMKEDVSYFPAMYRVHLDDVSIDNIFNQDIAEWIEDWRELWPTQAEIRKEYGASLTYDIKCSRKAVEKKMNTFLKDFHAKFSAKLGKTTLDKKKQLITQATKMYLSECIENNWAYTKKSMYFIEKDGDSLLEKYIWRILDGETASQAKSDNFYIS